MNQFSTGTPTLHRNSYIKTQERPHNIISLVHKSAPNYGVCGPA